MSVGRGGGGGEGENYLEEEVEDNERELWV